MLRSLGSRIPFCLMISLMTLVSSERGLRGEEATLNVLAPVSHQVIQRTGFVPAEAHSHQPGGPRLGYADVAIQVQTSEPGVTELRYRLLDQTPPEDGRTPLGESEWASTNAKREGNEFTGNLRIPAGGWYRLEFQGLRGDQVVALGAVEPFGVGEVFLIAGQSYADSANDERMLVQEPQGRVSKLDPATGKWQVAHDAELTPVRGTIWPPFGDLLVPILRVPVGYCNVAVGGTASREWLPGTPLYERLILGGSQLKNFRAICWQQGESDVIERRNRAEYIQNLKQIRETSCSAWGSSPIWLMAKSTLHPVVYNRPAEEGEIRAAIADLWKTPGFGPGPDTDTLDGENRGGVMSRQHFSGLGQRRAALLWFVAVFNEIHRQSALPTEPMPR